MFYFSRYISNHTGKTINDLPNAEYLYDNLYIEELYNYTLPEWTKAVYPEKLLDISKLLLVFLYFSSNCSILIASIVYFLMKFYSFRLDTFTNQLARLKIGPLVGEITEHFLSVILGQDYFKMKLYSCHDTTLASLMNGLGLKFDDLPPYASTLIFEVHSGDCLYIDRLIFQKL